MSGRGAFDLPIGWGGLHNTLGGGATPEGFWRRSWNASAERGSLGARPGIWDVSKGNARCWGVGYAQWEGYRALVMAASRVGAPPGRASLVVLDADTWASGIPPPGSQDTLSASPWSFVQYDRSVLALNAADGIWSWTVDRLGGAWARVPMRWQVAGRDPVRRVAPAALPAALDWTGGRTALVSEWPGAGRGATAPAVSVTDNAMTFTAVPQTGATSREALLRFGVDFGEAVDCRASRYLGFRVSVAISETEPRPHENHVYEASNAVGRLSAFASTDATAPPGNLADARWREVGAFAVPRASVGAQGTAAVDVVVDLDRGLRRNAAGVHDSAAWLSAIRRVMVVLPGRSGNTQVVTVGPLARGGAFLNKPDFDSPMTLTPHADYGDNLRDVDYVVHYHVAGTPPGAGGGYQQHRMWSTDATGVPLAEGAARMGAWAAVSWAAGAGPHSPSAMPRVRVWRRRWSDSGRWLLLHDAPNAAGSFVDSAVDDVRDPVAWPTATSLPATHVWDFSQGEFEDAAAGAIRPTCAAAWNTHLVVGAGGWVYLSQANNPGVFAPRPDDPTRQVNIDDDTGPRTVAMSADRSDVATAIVATDALYLVGRRSTSVMVGDTARSATPPRTLPNSRGAPSAQGACAHDGGVLVAAQDGLWWYRADLAGATATEALYQSVELTAGVRESWADLWWSDPSRPVVVQSREGEVWVVRGVRHMRRTKEGAWEEGGWDGAALESGNLAPPGGDPLYPVPGPPLPPGPPPGWVADPGAGYVPPPPPPPLVCNSVAGNWSLTLVVDAVITPPPPNPPYPWTAPSGGLNAGVFEPTTVRVAGTAHVFLAWIGTGPPADVGPVRVHSRAYAASQLALGPVSASNGLGAPATGGPAAATSESSSVVMVRNGGIFSWPFEASAATNIGTGNLTVEYAVSAAVEAGGCPP